MNQNLSRDEQKGLNELKPNNDINPKKADKGITTVIMNKTDKIKEGENLLNDEQSYKRLTEPMVKGTHNKVLHLITDLHREQTFYRNMHRCVINNGLSSEHFNLERGVRQGDPLSSYLFVVIIETLGIAIGQNKDEKVSLLGVSRQKFFNTQMIREQQY